MATLQRGGITVYAADRTYLGRLLRRDDRFLVVATSWWRLDFLVVPYEEVAAVRRSTLVLRCLADGVRLETAEPWSPPPDPLGNANGVDVEPLRAGMAEFDGKQVDASPKPRVSPPLVMSRPEPPLPSPDDIHRLDRERIERIDAQIDRYIAAELEDLLIAASCETPPGFEHAASYETAFGVNASAAAHRHPDREARIVVAVPAGDGGARVQEEVGPDRIFSFVGDAVARDPNALEQILRSAGLSALEAEAIVSGGYGALAALRPRLAERQAATSDTASRGATW